MAPGRRGSELYVSEVARRLSAVGTDVTVFSARYPGAASSETRDGIGYRRRGGHLTVYLWAALMLLARRFGRLDAVLEVQNGMPFLARLFTRARVVVLVHHVHREQWSILRPLLARFGWFMESKVAVRVNRAPRTSPSARSPVASSSPRCARPGHHHRLERSARAAGLRPPAPAAAPRVVVLSRLVPHKRVEHALEAVAALREELPGLHLHVMGSGWWSEHLLERRRELGLDDVVTFLGHVTDLEKFQELSSAWVHVLPSVKEGWGLSIVEAAQMGVPSVAYAEAGGVRESILDGVTGLLATDQDDLVDKLRLLLVDAELRARPGHQGPDPLRSVLLGHDGRHHRSPTGGRRVAR